jgi:hypothetical protein
MSLNHEYVVPETRKIQDENGQEIEAKNAIHGVIIVRKPTISERYAYVEECGFTVSEKGEMEAPKGNLALLGRIAEKARAHIVKVDLTRAEDGSKITSAEELYVDPDCDGILIELGSLVMNGFRPSKNLKP